jgi:uncharacterized delta-60 repeat protein
MDNLDNLTTRNSEVQIIDAKNFYNNLKNKYKFNNSISTIIVQQNGQTLIGGNFTEFKGKARNGLVRLNPDGTEDLAFYNNLKPFNNSIYAIAIQSNGKIIVSGFLTNLNGTTKNYLIRLNPDGSVDSIFCNNLGSGFNNTVSTIAIQPDGKILVGGAFTIFNKNTRNGLIRLNPDGTEDISFYNKLGNGFNGTIYAIAVQSDEKILISGSFERFNQNNRKSIIRLNSDGSEDVTFYNNLGSGFNNTVSTIAIQSNGKILVSGFFTKLNGNIRNRFVRLNSDGTEDFTFYDNNLGKGFNKKTIITITIHSNEKILILWIFYRV